MSAGPAPTASVPLAETAHATHLWRARASRPRLLTGALARVLGASFCALTSFYLLLSVVPMFAASAGSDGAAGPVTGVLMFGGVAGELCSTRLMTRFGERRVLVSGLVLLGVPALVPLAVGEMGAMLAICAVRGFGFGLTAVAGDTLIVSLLPADRRGEALGLLALVTSVPGILALPAGVWLADVGYPVVFAAAAAAALGGVALQLRRTATAGSTATDLETTDQPGRPLATRTGGETAVGLVEGLRRPEQHRPALVFVATTLAAGIVVAFLPLAAGSSQAAATALLAQTAAAAVGRLAAGRYGDRRGHTVLLVPGLATTVAGTAALAWAGNSTALTLGAVLFGIGFGVTQSATLAVMLQRASPESYGMVNAGWNVAYDLGYGAGPVAFGLLVATTGYPAAFAATAAAMTLAFLPAVRHQPRRRRVVCPRELTSDLEPTTA